MFSNLFGIRSWLPLLLVLTSPEGYDGFVEVFGDEALSTLDFVAYSSVTASALATSTLSSSMTIVTGFESSESSEFLIYLS